MDLPEIAFIIHLSDNNLDDLTVTTKVETTLLIQTFQDFGRE